MRYSVARLVFQEIPDELSLAISITGCPLRCSGCHSSEFWNHRKGTLLTTEVLHTLLQEWRPYITCVLYLGGEWEARELASQFDVIKSQDIKTALYTGLEFPEIPELISRLNYLKYGPYLQKRGPLSSPHTNQKLINIKTNECLNYHFLGKD